MIRSAASPLPIIRCSLALTRPICLQRWQCQGRGADAGCWRPSKPRNFTFQSKPNLHYLDTSLLWTATQGRDHRLINSTNTHWSQHSHKIFHCKTHKFTAFLPLSSCMGVSLLLHFWPPQSYFWFTLLNHGYICVIHKPERRLTSG